MHLKTPGLRGRLAEDRDRYMKFGENVRNTQTAISRQFVAADPKNVSLQKRE